jgi:hypothetical protein
MIELDKIIHRHWSDGLTRHEIAALLGVTLAHVRRVLERTRTEPRAGPNGGTVRSELGLLGLDHGLTYDLLYHRRMAGKEGVALVAPPWEHGRLQSRRPYVGAHAPMAALPDGVSPLGDDVREMIVDAQRAGWSISRIAQTLHVHPRQVAMVQAGQRKPDEARYEVAGEWLRIAEIANRTGLRPSTVRSRVRLGWRGLQLMRPARRRRRRRRK